MPQKGQLPSLSNKNPKRSGERDWQNANLKSKGRNAAWLQFVAGFQLKTANDGGT